jgi:hypothetical protein
MLAIIRSSSFFSSRLLAKNLKIGIYRTNFACGSVWVRNLISDIKEGT